MPAAVILLSGGLDSATTLAIAREQGYSCYALSFDYGQRHRHELVAAERIAESVGVVKHITAKIDLRAFGGSALTAEIPVPKDQIGKSEPPSSLIENRKSKIENSSSPPPPPSAIPITYVPARNTVFLSFALAWAEVLGAFDIFLGVNAIDYSGYPDCRPEFIKAFENVANLATRAGVEGAGKFAIHTPLIDKSKAEIIQWGLKLKVPYGLTHSCYDPLVGADGRVLACGHCDSCLLRLQGFAQAGSQDPVAYVG